MYMFYARFSTHCFQEYNYVFAAVLYLIITGLHHNQYNNHDLMW